MKHEEAKWSQILEAARTECDALPRVSLRLCGFCPLRFDFPVLVAKVANPAAEGSRWSKRSSNFPDFPGISRGWYTGGRGVGKGRMGNEEFKREFGPNMALGLEGQLATMLAVVAFRVLIKPLVTKDNGCCRTSKSVYLDGEGWVFSPVLWRNLPFRCGLDLLLFPGTLTGSIDGPHPQYRNYRPC
jgi:hypothetical protein